MDAEGGAGPCSRTSFVREPLLCMMIFSLKRISKEENFSFPPGVQVQLLAF